MKSVALRFADNFAPEQGTIAAHQELIDANGFVWYGKLSGSVSQKVANEVLTCEAPRILLIHSGATNRYWAYITEIVRATPPLDEIPSYYRDIAEKFGCWFRVIRFEKAPKNIMSKCNVISSKKPLSLASRQSMSPYFVIEFDEDGV